VVLLFETGELMCSVSDRVWGYGVVLLLETGDLMCSVTDRMWSLYCDAVVRDR